MRSSLLYYVLWNWKKVQCVFNDASVGRNFFQEMPACAMDDAFTPVWQAVFALHLRIRLEQIEQLYVAHVLNHFLWRRTERVVGFVLMKISLKRLSVRMVLNLLDQFTNTRILSIFHNRMWQSRYSEVNVNLVQHWLLVTLRVTCVTANNGLSSSLMIWVWIWLDWLGTFQIVEQLVHLVVEQLLNPILSSNHVSRRSLEEAEVTHILFRIWLLQFPSEQLSEYNKLGVFREEWKRSIVFDRTSILSSEQNWCRPNIPYSDVSSMFYACTVHDVVHSSRLYQDPYGDSHGIHRQKEYFLSLARTLTSKYQSRIDDGM